MNNVIPITKWGKDHWSAFLYAETRAIDYKGVLDNRHMRCDPNIHPDLVSRLIAPNLTRYPTRLANNELQEDHDDWSCLEDMVAEGLLTMEYLTGNRVKVALLPRGAKVALKLRQHKANEQSYSTFVYKEEM